jgi:hypothetical protein
MINSRGGSVWSCVDEASLAKQAVDIALGAFQL